jgi:hypothetical protein
MAAPTPTQADIDAFTENVKHMVTLQDQLRLIASKSRESRVPVKEAFDAVQLNIISFMKNRGIDVCNYQDEKIELQNVVRSGSLTKKTLKTALDEYFGEENQPDADNCYRHVLESLGSRELDILKRVKKRAKKGQAAAVPAGVSVSDLSQAAEAVHEAMQAEIEANDDVPMINGDSDDE